MVSQVVEAVGLQLAFKVAKDKCLKALGLFTEKNHVSNKIID